MDEDGPNGSPYEMLEKRDQSETERDIPAGHEDHLVKFDSQASASDIKKYQKLIGSVLYAQIGTRPASVIWHLSFAVFAVFGVFPVSGNLPNVSCSIAV
jgi:hypothetical protein